MLGKGQAASGEFIVDDAELAAAYICHALRVYHRQVDVGFEGPSCQVPQEVNQAVWQHDGGRCVQCGATDYLEFDHVSGGRQDDHDPGAVRFATLVWR